jgi:trehalose-6-phosphate synthase
MDSKTDERKILESTIQTIQKKLVKLRSASYSQDPRTVEEGAFKRRLIVVSNRLPVTATRNANGSLEFKQSSGGLVSAIQSVRSKLRFLWIGWLGIEIALEEQQAVSEKLLAEFNCIPVFLPEAIATAFYAGFCNDIIWPVLHYQFEPGVTTSRFDDKLWNAYVVANKMFSEVTIKAHEPNDVLWLQDYHLMLLSKLIRDVLPTSNIGWFLHTPWCCSDVFGLVPSRKELIEGILAANVVAFHTHDYARHFLRSCKFVLPDVVLGPGSCSYSNLKTIVHVSPIGIEPDDFAATLDKDETKALMETYCLKYPAFSDQVISATASTSPPGGGGGGIASEAETLSSSSLLVVKPLPFRVIITVDRLDPIKGVIQRLLCLQHLFRNHPEWVGRLVVIQVCVPSRADVEAYAVLTRKTNELVSSINSEFGTLGYQPIQYLYHSVTPSELAALYCIADVCVITSLRDGYNLVSSEYIACHAAATCSRRSVPGVLVLSEFCGAAQSLVGALRCNPWSIDDVERAIIKALVMSDLDRELRHEKNASFVIEHTSTSWALDNIAALNRIADSIK